MDERLVIQAETDGRRVRLEDFLLGHFGDLSKMYLRDIVKGGMCEVNGRTENRGFRVRTDDLIEIVVDRSRETSMRAERMDLDIVFEDEHLIVINKPAGMLVHPSHREKTGTLLNGLTFYLNQTSPTAIRPGLVHRLDKQTSGLIVVAKTAAAHRRLAAEFQKKRVRKRYLALVEGVVARDEGTIEAPIGRYAELKHWSVKQDGKHSESRFWVRERCADTTLIELEPVTGRTNQLRIHCELIGHPIVGDTRRGGRQSERLCLHAFNLAVRHPVHGEILEFQVDPPFGIKN